jgi:tetracycline resistance efflux pump
MSNSWIVILPPLIVLGLAAWTHNVIRSLLIGIAAAALIATDFSPLSALNLIKNVIIKVASLDNIYLFIFLIILGILIEMMTHAGGIMASTNFLKKYVRDGRQAETTSLILSNIFILDDYLNGLIVGAIMKPLMDTFRIPRAKLAFLLNSISSPICVLIPVTSWVAITLAYFQTNRLSDRLQDNPVIFADPLYTYLQIIPFIFYSIFIIISAWFIVRNNIAFGAMKKYEQEALETGNLYGGKNPIRQSAPIEEKNHGSMWAFFIPLGTFIATIILGILYSGDSILLGGTKPIMVALREAAPLWSLFVGSLVALTVTTIYYLIQNYISIQKIFINVREGLELTRNSIIILFLAYVFGALLIDYLDVGTYLATTVAAVMPLALLPVVTFLVGTAITASTGSSWSTIAIMIPIMIGILSSLATGTAPFTIAAVPQFFATMGALLSGAVAGAHMSPITDSTVMSSTASGCYHLDHVKTQIAYSMPALIGTSVGFIIMGLMGNQTTFMGYFISFFSGLITTLGILWYKNQNR